MRIKINFKSNSGFSLMEVIVAITIIVVGMIAIMSLMTTNITTGSYDRQKIVAINLAQEGIELVRNIRDSNWAAGDNWDKNITSVVNKRTDYNDNGNFGSQCGTTFLGINANGFYDYDDKVTNTNFWRCININKIGDKLEVTSEVGWTERSKPHSVKITSHLYDWKQNP